MKNRFLISAVLALLPVGACFSAQTAVQPAGETPTVAQPKVKSQSEAKALQAMLQLPDPDARIKAADEFLTKYADSEFKGFVLTLATQAYQQKGDFTDMVIYGERALEADPKNYMVRVWLANGIAQRTREFDLDKDEKLRKVEKYAHEAIDILKTAPKPRPDLPDAQWNQIKADFTAEAHDALALVAMVRKNYDGAISEFKTAVSLSPSPDPARDIRLAEAYTLTGKPDEAIALLDKLMATPDLDPSVKQAAQAERVRAIQVKQKAGGVPLANAGAAATAPAAAPAPLATGTKKP